VLCCCLLLLPDGTAGALTLPQQVVRDVQTGSNGHRWPYGFRMELTDDSLLRLTVTVHLVGARGVTPVMLRRAQGEWQAAVRQIWNRQCTLIDGGGRGFPIDVTLRFQATDADHEIIVWPGAGGSDALHWHILDSAKTVAHEFGHLLGAYDEYPRGALDPETLRVDADSVMHNHAVAGRIMPRHFAEVQRWFARFTGDPDCRIVCRGPDTDNK